MVDLDLIGLGVLAMRRLGVEAFMDLMSPRMERDDRAPIGLLHLRMDTRLVHSLPR